jgi:N12 class adenine-specific DNA methylase/adenine-specific DNA methylase
MASKYQLITDLYESTIQTVTNTPTSWTAFLRSACRNYKCRFDEQILIYAQRPDATAVLEIEKWNKHFGRWVNRGATGIAVFDDEHDGRYRLKHYFDISDTHESRFAQRVPLWTMEPRFEAEVIESLDNSFGDLEDKSSLAGALISAAKNAALDNMADYLRDLMYSREDSFLEELDDFNVDVEYRTALQNSVAYMLLTRCGIDAAKYFNAQDFRYVTDFNTRNTANALGLAASDIAELCLREIAATVRSLRVQEREENRTFAKPESPAYPIPINQNDERSAGYGTDLSDGGRLPRTESDRAGGISRNPWQIRIAPQEVSEATPPRPVPESPDSGNAERTPDGDRADGHKPDGAAHRADGGGAGRDGGIESREPNAVGGADEQHQALGGGIGTQRPDLQLKPLPTISDQLTIFGEAEEPAKAESSAFSISQQIIDEVLTSGGNEESSILRIAAYFKKDHIPAVNADFLQKEYRRYGSTGKGFIFGGNHVSVWFGDNGILIAHGDTAISADYSTLVTWEQAARRIRELLDMGRFMPQSELDKVDGNEIKELSEQLWYLRRDVEYKTYFSFVDEDLFKHGYPDDVARIAELLAKPEEREKILAGIKDLITAYEQDNSVLRFRSATRYLSNLLSGLSDLQLEPLTFTADESVTTARPSFITQDELDKVLTGGGQVENGKYRIYSFFLQGHTAKEKADFLKNEYGTGGGSRTGFDEWHDSKGISYSRANNHMPYDKVVISWPKVARRIDELIAAGRYMSQSQFDYLPEYEKGVLSSAIYNFYYNQPDEIARPYPYAMYVTDAIKIIRPQLDQPERVAEILSQMAAILDNTADFDRNYASMQKAFIHLTAYQNGAFSLFTPVKPTEQTRTEAPAQPTAPAAPPADEAAQYGLQLGATVYLGIEEYEIVAFDEARVELRDATMPLFTREMPRDEFDRKLRENRLNDGLIKAAPDLATSSATADSPRVIYKRYLAKLAEEITRSEIYPFLHDSDTEPDEAEDAIGAFVDAAAASKGYPGLKEAFDLSGFREWLIEDILDRTYQDVSIGSNGIELHERDADAPEWAQSPSLEESILEELSLRGFAASDELIAEGIEAYSSRHGMGDHEVIAELIENEFLTEEPAPEQEPTPYTPRKGERYEIQGRLFVVDTVDTDRETISLRDITFQSNTGFPIFRSESLDFIRMYDPIQREPEAITPKQKKEPISGLKEIVIDLTPRDSEFVKDHIPQPEEERLTPAWEKPKPRSRTQTFDPHPEIPQASRHNYRITDDNLGAGGQKTKFKNNIEAIRTLRSIEAENRFATPEEQEILAHYVGWGGLPQAFDPDHKQWMDEYAELKALLTPEEYASARASTLNAHYTSPTVIKAIYKAIENMGFKTGNVLEPSCGIGHFFGLLPESMSDSKLFGVELDGVTGRIAQQLYQKNSVAVQGYEATNLPDSFFDLAVGNVPFGEYHVQDKRYDKHKFLIHDYFFARTLDKVRPGGVIAFVTSKGTLDKANPAVRKYIAQRADLLGAIRLPNNAFKANAGTEVTTDIIFLQKRDRIIDIEPDWVHIGKTEDGVPINSYFLEHPDMVLGEMVFDDKMYGNKTETACIPFPDSDLAEQLAGAITNIHAEITEYERGEDEPEEDNSIPADPSVRNFSYTISDGQIFYRQDSRMVPVEMPVTTQNRVKGLIELRECVRRLIEYQAENYPESDIRTEQARLNRLYDSFTKKYGLINSRGNSMAFGQDSAYCLLCSLEIIDENGELERKADMFQKRTIKPHIPITHVDTASEALAVSMSEKARVDLDYMAELTGQSRDALIKELEGVIFLNVGTADSQDKTYVTADEYLSGNVREKLVHAKAAQVALGDGSLDVNVRALEAAIPPDLTAAEISVRLGATWLPEDVIQRFMYELLQPSGYARDRIKVHYSDRLGEWSITEKNADRSNIHSFNTYGTQRVNAYKIIEDILNLRDVRVFDTVYEDGVEKRVLNKKETAIAQAKQEIIRAKFEEWIWKDPARRERLCRLYNDRFNSIRPREYDGSPIKFVGMNPEIVLRKHQIDAIAHILYGGNTLLAHEVGAGKTYEMVAAAMESKRLGLCNKSLIVVPNHITEQWSAEFLQLYPSANILVATKKDFETKNRKKFCARIATGDYDAVIIGHSQFEKIPMSLERQERMIQRQIDDLVDAIDETKRNKGERYTIKQLERMKKSLEVKLAKLNDQSRKDDVVTFEELGIDRLFIDEAHYFKNLFLITKMRNVGGIAQVEAQKSSDLFMKTQYLDELTGGRGTVFATGTPISNSMVEMYTMQRYLQYKNLVKNGLQHFDAWASTFGETVTAIELAPEGTGYRAKTRFAKFYNLPELMSMFRMVADIQTADMLHLPVPKANFHTEVIKPSQWQRDMIAELAERAERIRNREVDPATDNMLKVTNDGRKLALDQRLINPLLPDDPDGKVAACAANVFRIWEQHREKRLTQLVFCDLSTPKADGAFNVYDDLKAKLLAKGIPEHEIAFIHNADTEAKKKELFAKVRKGQVRVLMGSTQKMGAGTNVQDKLIALHDLDCPWRPSDLAQRLGRIVRQGNKNPEVEIFRYVTEGTFDSYLYQLVENKQKFISQIMTSKLPVRSAEDVDETALSYAEIKALATGNPLIIEKCQLEMDVNKLKILHASHLSQKYALEDKILKDYPQGIKRLTERITGYKTDTETTAKHSADKDHFPPMKIGGIFYAEKAEAGKAIIEACKAMTSPDPVALGEYRGFQMILSFDTFAKEYRVTLSGALSHTVALGSDIHGNITRLDNALERFAESLQSCEIKLEEVRAQLQTAKGEVDRPFPQEQEYTEKAARLKELNILLNMDEKDHEILDTEPDEGDMEPQPRTLGRER